MQQQYPACLPGGESSRSQEFPQKLKSLLKCPSPLKPHFPPIRQGARAGRMRPYSILIYSRALGRAAPAQPASRHWQADFVIHQYGEIPPGRACSDSASYRTDEPGHSRSSLSSAPLPCVPASPGPNSAAQRPSPSGVEFHPPQHARTESKTDRAMGSLTNRPTLRRLPTPYRTPVPIATFMSGRGASCVTCLACQAL